MQAYCIRPGVKYILSIIAALFLLNSCVVGEPVLESLVGNYHFLRGENQDAMVHYLRVWKHEGNDGPWVAYNLGNVYYSLGDIEAAFRLWDNAVVSSDKDLLFAVHFNRGLAHYDLGAYESALDSFRTSLTIYPASLDAKKNLELSWLKLQASQQHGGLENPQIKAPIESERSKEFERIFDYVKRKETRLWNQTPEDTNPPGLLDY